ncbi:MAG: hypothetical protein K9L82_13190 [Chromatiaceae bacterium]|nr:hypothetical protein [Chromatiaceae bacterium]MCF7993539.1 hypothetical protein [Chromatiaceae bacterium]MCF8014477.1 hypothetical protein [Chromatiaceae bacterium]
MSDNPCLGLWDSYWNKDICSILSDAGKLATEFEGAANKLRIVTNMTDDVWAKAKLRKAAEGFEEAGKKLGVANKANEAIKVFSLIKTFHENYKKITPDLIENNPDAAASAFGNMLAAGGEALEKIGPPVNVYAPILKEAGGLIDGVLHGLVPSKRRGTAWDQYRRAMNNDLRGDKGL